MQTLEFSEMAAALAHEIKNPAAVALAHVNLLRLDNKDETITFHLNHIETALTDICELVREMLSSAQNSVYEVDLHKILGDILQTYRAAWPDIVFCLNLPEKNAHCLGHETSLRMIFSNLIKNAVEAIEAATVSGEIHISAKAREEFLCVTVTDNAVYLPQASKTDGNGLGLAICRNLASGIGARLSAKTTASGGLAVTVELRSALTLCPSFA